MEQQVNKVKSEWNKEDPAKRAQDIEDIKKVLDEQVNNVNFEERTKKINELSTRLDEIVGPNSTFGSSLSEGNLKGIIVKELNSFQQDLDNLKNDNKPSGVFLDVDDLNMITDRVINQLKSEKQDETEAALVELQSLDPMIKELGTDFNLDEKECNEKHEALISLMNFTIKDQEAFEKGIESNVTKE